MQTKPGTPEPVEIELKLEFDPADRGRLLAALGSMTLAGAPRQLISTYFDTPGQDLADRGYSLRVRKNGSRRIQTVKAKANPSAGLFERPEWERPLRGDRPRFDARSGPLIDVLGSATLGRVEPLFATTVERLAFTVSNDEADIEVAIDHGEVRANERAAPICELELELTRGPRNALFDLARRLNEQVPLRLGVLSKAERGYALVNNRPPDLWTIEPISLDQDGGAYEAFRVVCQACIRHFRLNEAALLGSGSAGALHQARVALRRLRSAFSIWGALLDGDPQVELLKSELHWLAIELGRVRNIDVLIKSFDGAKCDELVAARDQEFRRVRAELTDARTRILMIDLAGWLAGGRPQSELVHPRRRLIAAKRFATDILEVRRKRLGRYGEGFPKLDRKRRHRVRIEAKKLYYAAQFFASFYPGDKASRRRRRFEGALEALLDTLGILNDMVVGPKVLAGLGIAAELTDWDRGRRKRLLDRAHREFAALMRAKRFW